MTSKGDLGHPGFETPSPAPFGLPRAYFFEFSHEDYYVTELDVLEANKTDKNTRAMKLEVRDRPR